MDRRGKPAPPVTYLVTPVSAFWLSGHPQPVLHAAPVKDDDTVAWEDGGPVEVDDALVRWVGTYLQHLTKVIEETIAAQIT
jgi:hypothetical protein